MFSCWIFQILNGSDTVALTCDFPEDFVTIAKTLDKVAKEVGVNFLGGYSALVSKGMTPAEDNLIR